MIDPSMECILLTPICPHSLFARTVVFGGDAVLEAHAVRDEDSEVFLTVDGSAHFRCRTAVPSISGVQGIGRRLSSSNRTISMKYSIKN